MAESKANQYHGEIIGEMIGEIMTDADRMRIDGRAFG